ncbi:DegT/DnrJ/EryC1/StrS aminotransferase family protein [Mesorhizobium sp. M4B.F.Ca.ET.214.01.1.1]|nr:DegT/DnrJ/EryC1/StrS aminotransferase family protein [Mesorhizobium sp. M4B.F.Ca.ET.214.01.1.1]TGQ62459.1 DegT/DnrJ/EryC1/StrS aminotransferase family protein [Mesorhizobium sp. M4B.F.Ca.ET.211.01.1.1]TGU39661.1 DegT/DnrJ/EryC1/StrS aminotransferase family protein [Mesorhizobium sp. M4B.F.Ca.ET.150.01.1.1]
MTKPNAVPMNDLKRLYQRYEVKIDREVASTLRSGWWLNGSTGRRFAANFAEFVGVSDCVLVANGTDALELALASVARLGDTRGREVIMTANAGGYASCACWHNDLIPHYVDIEPASQLVSVAVSAGSSLRRYRCNRRYTPLWRCRRCPGHQSWTCTGWPLTHSDRRGLRSGARGPYRRQYGRVTWRYRYFQLLPDQESRRDG